MTYSAVALIYNPNSTNAAEQQARAFADELEQRTPKQPTILIATEKPGHGEQLSYECAKTYKNPLVVSVSGDGGYNDVINGIMKAKQEGFAAVAGLLPAGNANDHYHALHDEDSHSLIRSGKVKTIDLLQLTAISHGKEMTRFAHSYIGFGLTPAVGKELNKNKLTFVKEIIITIKSFISHTAVPLKIDGTVNYYESIVCSNIDTMSKYLKISQPSSVSDGEFEITAFRKRPKLKLLQVLFNTTLGRIEEDRKTSEFNFETVTKTLVQMDGEIITLDAKSPVSIVIAKRALDCVV